MWSKRESLQFTIKLGLRKGSALIRGMRRSLTDDEQSVWRKLSSITLS
jgi:predicted DNA-binding ribbon-helix-helix protein